MLPPLLLDLLSISLLIFLEVTALCRFKVLVCIGNALMLQSLTRKSWFAAVRSLAQTHSTCVASSSHVTQRTVRLAETTLATVRGPQGPRGCWQGPPSSPCSWLSTTDCNRLALLHYTQYHEYYFNQFIIFSLVLRNHVQACFEHCWCYLSICHIYSVISYKHMLQYN